MKVLHMCSINRTCVVMPPWAWAAWPRSSARRAMSFDRFARYIAVADFDVLGLQRTKMKATGFFMLGYPGETRETF